MTETIRISRNAQITWRHGQTLSARCRNCGHAGEMALVLEEDFKPPRKHFLINLLRCPACTACFTDIVPDLDYGDNALVELGLPAYLAQVGAGLWPIAAQLARIDKPAGSRLLEIGGGYGFGLDIGVHGLGWQGVGYDPSPFGAFGRRELGLDLRADYFTEAQLGESWDVIAATELIEHLPDPPAYLRLMRQAIAPDGVMLLTTPDAATVTPGQSTGKLVSALAVGAHLVLQTGESLTQALQAAGFAHVRIVRDETGLIAYASPAPLALREGAGRAVYRAYLAKRARETALGTDTQLGFAGRGLFDATIDGDYEAADAAWAAFTAGVVARFGRMPEALPEAALQAKLPALSALMPLGLGQALFARAMSLLARGEARPGLEAMFSLSARAARALCQAMEQMSQRDPFAENIASLSQREALLCAAEAGDAAALPALLAQGEVAAAWRGFVGLVNAGRREEAAALRAAGLGELPPEGLELGLRQDGAFTAGMLALQGQDFPRAVAAFAALRLLLPEAAHPLRWPGLRGEVIALFGLGQGAEAVELLRGIVALHDGAPEDLLQHLG